MYYWKSTTRWYTARIMRDLFGDWTVVRCWGGFGTKRGNYRIDVVDDLASARARIRAIHAERVRRYPPYRRVA